MGKTCPCSFNLPDGISAELFHYFNTLPDACATKRMAAAQQAAVGVNRHVSSKVGPPFLDEEAAFAFFAEAQVFVFNYLGNGETISGSGARQ